MKGYFMQRGFDQLAIEETIGEVLLKPREEALVYKKKESTDRVPFVLTYHPRLRMMGKVLHKNYKLLQSNALKKHFPVHPWWLSRG